MKNLHAFSLIALCGIASGQTIPVDQEKDPVLEAILEFNRRKAQQSEKAPPANEPADDNTPAKAVPVDEDSIGETDAPVLVTGKPPADAEVETNADETTSETPDAPHPVDTSELQPEETEPGEKGPAVRVEKIRAGQAADDASQIQLRAPFPAKPMNNPSPGWKLETAGDAPDFIREVELAPGSTITLTIRPHLLRPDVDGHNTFSIPEPGYEPGLGYRQTDTVGAILGTSIRQLDEDTKQLGLAIDRLQQLLISLPKPEETSSATSR